ncbi:MAG: DUF6033 family protein [Suilimivivens sp.]
MAGNVYGISSYQQTNQAWKSNSAAKKEKNTSSDNREAAEKIGSDGKVSEWKPISGKSPLVPASREGYGTVIGDVKLSDEAKNYYDKLKSKFHGMDFILVSKDMKSQVAANAVSYGNAMKPVVLIDEEKLERMATDESFRKKYEGIIAMSQTKLQETKNSLVSTGANVKNFGMSIASDGRASFFVTVEKANAAQIKALKKRQAEKKAEKAKEKKQAEKKAQADRLEKQREENKANESSDDESADGKEYIEFIADSVEELINKVSKYAYENSYGSTLTDKESKLGQNFDFKG